MSATPLRTLATVISNDAAMPDTRILWLEAPEIAATARPGQFVMLKCNGHNLLRRPLSIHRLNSDKTRLAFLFAIVGQGTAWLATIKAGEQLDLLGPLGRGFDVAQTTKKAVLIAGGLGVAPLTFLADELISSGVKTTLLYGAATAKLLCPNHLLPEALECAVATEDGSYGRQGFITSYLPEYLEENSELFACGPTPMYRTLANMDVLKDRDLQISLEMRMACGLGVCYGCTIRTSYGLQQACHHGPVFKMRDILWDELSNI